MRAVWKPENVSAVQSSVNDAIRSGYSLEIVGNGSKRQLGRPVDASITLDVSGLKGIQLYEPEELILVVAPGTLLSDVNSLLESHGQHLAFEPPDYGPLWGQAGDRGTIGGAIMSGRGGPRRLTAGAARDFMLGVKAINGSGELFSAGGRVVKNVTGFDLPKLVTGSFGTLCVVVELTLKVLPKAPESATFVLCGLDVDEASTVIQDVFRDMTAQVSSAAFLPMDIACHSSVAEIQSMGESVTLLRLEGFGLSVMTGLDELSKVFRQSASTKILDKELSKVLWKEIGGAHYFALGESPLWFLSVPPACGAHLGKRLAQELNGRFFFDWAGGGIWFETPNNMDADAFRIRQLLAEVTGNDGHATLIRADERIRSVVSPFQPLPQPLALMNQRVRLQFDPDGVFNPGRMYENIHAD